MVHGPRAGLEQLAATEDDAALAGAVRPHLLELARDSDAARAHYELAARRTFSVPERRYLESRAARLGAASARVGRGADGVTAGIQGGSARQRWTATPRAGVCGVDGGMRRQRCKAPRHRAACSVHASTPVGSPDRRGDRR